MLSATLFITHHFTRRSSSTRPLARQNNCLGHLSTQLRSYSCGDQPQFVRKQPTCVRYFHTYSGREGTERRPTGWSGYAADIQLRRSRKVGGSYVHPEAKRFSSRRADHNKMGPSDATVRRATTGNSFSTSRRNL